MTMPSENTMRAETGAGFEPDFTALPPAQTVNPYPGMPHRMQRLLDRVSNVTNGYDDNWDIISATGKLVKTPKKDGRPMCGKGAACAFAELRDTMGGGRVAFALNGDTIWHLSEGPGPARMHPIASIQNEFSIPSSDHMKDIEEFFRRALEQIPHARVHVGVKFKNMAFGRFPINKTMSRTETVRSDDPRFEELWALEFPDIDYDEKRARRFHETASSLLDGKEAVEMLARVVAAPVAQPYLHGLAVLSGAGGNGKGLLLKSALSLYGKLAAPFSFGSAFGASRTSSTMSEQAPIPLLTHLLAVDSDAPDPGRGDVDKIKKATAGEELTCRSLQQNSVTANVTAFMMICVNHGSTLASTDEWKRRIWNVPFGKRLDDEEAKRWGDYLGDGSDPSDGIIDALMAGCDSFAHHRDDPVTANQLTEGMTDYGRLLRDKLMSCAPLGEDGLPDSARVRVDDEELRETRASQAEIRRQRDLMGLGAKTMNDIHGDHRNHQCVYVQDPGRFAPFAAEWRKEHAEAEQERAQEEDARQAEAERIRGGIANADPLPVTPQAGRIQGQVELMRECENLDAKLVITDRWEGKAIKARWNDDTTIQHDLRGETIPTDVERAGLLCDRRFLVVDLDQSKEDGPCREDGLDTLVGLDVTEEDLDTLIMRSAHGYHLVYELPEEWVGKLKATTRVNGTNIDLRPGGKSYVVAPGSHLAITDTRTGLLEECDYPGVIRMPSRRADGIDGPGQTGRRVPQLPDAIKAFIEQDPNSIEHPSSGPSELGPHDSRTAFRSQRGAGRIHPNTTPYTPGNRHNEARTQSWALARQGAEQGADQATINECMDAVRRNAGDHDPQDTELLIESATRKNGYQYIPR